MAGTIAIISVYRQLSECIYDIVYSAKRTTQRCSHLTIRAGRTTTGAVRTFSSYAVVNTFIRAGLEIAYAFLIFRTWCIVSVRFRYTEQTHNVVSGKKQ